MENSTVISCSSTPVKIYGCYWHTGLGRSFSVTRGKLKNVPNVPYNTKETTQHLTAKHQLFHNNRTICDAL